MDDGIGRAADGEEHAQGILDGLGRQYAIGGDP
jgi:hypothetical protein